MTSESGWFLARPGSQDKYGPYDSARVREMIAARQATSDMLVWREGQPQWDLLGVHFPEVSAIHGSPTPPAAAPVAAGFGGYGAAPQATQPQGWIRPDNTDLLVPRAVAYIVDQFLLQIALAILFVAVFCTLGLLINVMIEAGMEQGAAETLGGSLILLLAGLISLVGTLVFLGKDGLFSGRSPGKAMMSLQTVDATSWQPIGFQQSIKRNLVLLIPFMPLILAFQMQQPQRMGDVFANTMVIRG
ncbi:MAG: RDD family protein [Sumerlaeia bacterium]